MKAFVGAKFYPVEGSPVDAGVLLVKDGKILALETRTTLPSDAEIIDLEGRVVLPGLVDAHSHVGLWGDGEGTPSVDGNERPGPITAEVRAQDAVNPEQRSFAGAREGGITTIQVHPGSANPIGGLSFACKTVGRVVDDMVLRAPSGLKGALGENPKRVGSSQKQSPYTRMGSAALIRDFFHQTREYLEKRESADKTPNVNLGYEHAALVLRGEIPFRVHAHRADDIITVVRLAEEFGIAYNIEHCTEGYRVAEYLGKRQVIAHVGPGLSSRPKVETAYRTESNAAQMAEMGVQVSLITDHPFLDSRYFLAYAGVAHAHGLSFVDTLRAITLNPARSIGVADRVGSLKAGKDADFIVLAGEPFSYRAPILSTYIVGEEVYTRPHYE